MSDLKQKILANVKDDLAEIEKALKENLTPHLDIVSQTASHILFSGGKRLRPLLMVLSARLCGYTGNHDKIFSTVFEYLHVASLLHDDLVDKATLRRGKPVAHSIWGNSIAVLVGDFLLARCLSIGIDTGKLKVIKVIAEITENMSQGEIHQLIRKGNINLSESEYMEVILRKTAALIQGACRVGALIADASEEEETALSNYGLNIGMAFQIADDLLDYTSETESLGKEIGADLKEGKVTLPVIYTLKKADAEDRKEIEKIIRNASKSQSGEWEHEKKDFQILTEMLKKYRGIDYTKEKAKEYIINAKDAISVFRHSNTKDILLNIADYTLERNI